MCRNSDDRSEAAARDLEAAGGSDAPIEIAAYNREWPSRFAAEVERLQSNAAAVK